MRENDFIRRIAIDLAIQPDVVKKVVEWQMETLKKEAWNCNSMEITGLGTFKLRRKPLEGYIRNYKKKMEHIKAKYPLLDTERKRRNASAKIGDLERDLKELIRRYEVE